MGGTFSRAAGGPVTRQQLLDATSNNRAFIQKLFNVMIGQLTHEDLLALANPQQCNKYVFLMADTLQKMFRALKIRPARDKSTGIIYFQKTDKLTEKTTEMKTYCLEIAYFYIRIFQIFGALALSVLDDPSAGMVLSQVGYVEPPTRAGLGFGRRPAIPGLEAAMFGGADPANMDKGGARTWKIISNDLTDKIQKQIGSRYFDVYEFRGNPDLSLVPDLQSHNIDYVKDSEKMFAKATLSIPRSSWPRQIRIIITGWELRSKIKSNISIINEKIKRVQKQVVANQKNETADWIVGDTLSLTDGIVVKFEEMFKLTEELEADPRKAVQTGLVPSKQLKTLPTDQKQGYSADTFIKRPLQTKYIIDSIKQLASGQKTTSFCVARALQLLNAPTLFSPRSTTARSGVCLSRFDQLPFSVPESGTKIAQVPGIKAMDQLFYDEPHLDSKDGTASIDVSDRARYQEVLKILATTFAGKEPAKMTSIDAILAKSPSCAADAAKHYLKLKDPKAVKEVLGIVNQMFGRQLVHTRRVVEFISKKLVMIYTDKGGRSISLHPALLKGGIAEVNKLGVEAREILVDYYKGCEDLYQKGLGRLVGNPGAYDVIPN